MSRIHFKGQPIGCPFFVCTHPSSGPFSSCQIPTHQVVPGRGRLVIASQVASRHCRLRSVSPLQVRLRLVIAGSVPYRHCQSNSVSSLPAVPVIVGPVPSSHCQSGFVSSLPAVTGNLADCKVDGCRRRALRAARAYAVHPSCRFLSRWVQLQCFKGSQWQGGAPIDFANLKKEHDLHR